jgi:hypothetical protein
VSGSAANWFCLWLFMVFAIATLLAGVRDAVRGNTVELFCASAISAFLWCLVAWSLKVVLT